MEKQKVKIVKIQKNKLYLDNLEVIDVNKDILFEYKLRENQDITLIYRKILYSSCLAKAIYLVNIKIRSESEIKLKLMQKYKDEKVILDVIKRLNELCLLDDLNYAIMYIESNISKGENYLKKNLLLKGINMKTIEKALSDFKNDEAFSQYN